MKSTQSGFAIAGVALVMVAILAGSAYVFRNAGTSEDLVAQVSDALVGRSGAPMNSGSGTRPCPRKCLNLKARSDAARVAADRANKATENACRMRTRPDGVQEIIDIISCRRAIEVGKKANDAAYRAADNYVRCINQNAAWQSCPHRTFPYSWNINAPELQCHKLEADLEQERIWLLNSIDSYKKCMENAGSRPYCGAAPNGAGYESTLMTLGFYCPDSARNKPSSSDIIKGASRR